MIVRTIPHTYQFYPPPYDRLYQGPRPRRVPVRVLQTGALRGYHELPASARANYAPRVASVRMVRPLGLGQTGTGKAIVLSAPQIATTTLTTASAMGAQWATAAIPVVGPIIAGVTTALMLIFGRKRPKQKRATTEIVDEIEPHLKANLRGYLEGPRNPESQAQALANFDAGWQLVLENCCPGGVQANCGPMGDPGRWCIDDRKPGGPHDWFAYYRTPIADDPVRRAHVQGEFVQDRAGNGAGLVPAGAGKLPGWLLGGALLAAAAVV